MLEFRKINFDQDLDEIIKLIQKNLDSDFTREHFVWKHLENPFGKSYGLIALDGNKIVGLRMFMYWKFFDPKDGSILNAIRPVDTVVDNDYRGQGLFKKLTLTGLEECKAKYELIFNTPNKNSLPGYLKMGWQKLEQVDHFKISIVNPFFKSSAFQEVEADSITYKQEYSDNTTMSTYKSSEYFKWRYKSNKYNIAYFPGEEVYVAYGISSRYLIIYEVFGNTGNVSNKILNSLAKKKSKPFMYYYNNEGFDKLDLPVTIKRSRPVIVLKDHKELKTSGNMDFSLADLESVF